MKSELGCTLRTYFRNVMLTSQKPCQHNNKCDCSKTNGYKWSLCFSIKYRGWIPHSEKLKMSQILLVNILIVYFLCSNWSCKNKKFINQFQIKGFKGVQPNQRLLKVLKVRLRVCILQKCVPSWPNCSKHYWKLHWSTFNTFTPNGFSHSYHMHQSFSVLRVIGWYFSFLFNC